MWPDEPIAVDRRDDRHLPQDRVPLRRRDPRRPQHALEPRAVLHRHALLLRERCGRFTLQVEHPADRQEADGSAADGDAHPWIPEALAERGHECAHVERRTAAGPLFLARTGKEIDLDHLGVRRQADWRNASPMGSIRRGATSSVTSDSNAPSRTTRFANGLAGSTRSLSRAASRSRRPGARDPPPHT